MIESTARITRRYLMNKTKHGICDVVFLLLRHNDQLEAEVKRLRLAAEGSLKPKPPKKSKANI
ncbi:hypothetical protein [Methylorubrum populi]|uniref:hypothetical protein n=1 Tax=Methylorubrum populi TaxID=223967 RepID=UPI00235682C3|nr:hypothetical protein [Methylorubrum populi]